MTNQPTPAGSFPGMARFFEGAMTIKELCSTLTLGKTKVYEEIAAGRIKVLKAGRRTIVPITEVQAYMERLAGK